MAKEGIHTQYKDGFKVKMHNRRILVQEKKDEPNTYHVVFRRSLDKEEREKYKKGEIKSLPGRDIIRGMALETYICLTEESLFHLMDGFADLLKRKYELVK